MVVHVRSIILVVSMELAPTTRSEVIIVVVVLEPILSAGSKVTNSVAELAIVALILYLV